MTEVVARAAFRCSVAAQERGDAPWGTAAPAQGFVLVERPGPWGRQALTMSRLDPAVGTEIGRRAVASGRRALLIRRPGRPASPSAPDAAKRWFLVDARPGSERIVTGTYRSDPELLDLDVAGMAGDAWPRPLWCVCTHGRHDACCAIRGRPLAATLTATRDDEVWECSHVGGDRFAANLLVLPHGLYYGNVTPTNAPDIVSSYDDGRLVDALLRGRSTVPAAVQAAQHHARVRFDVDAIAAFPPRSAARVDPRTHRVVLDGGGSTVTVVVRLVAAGPPTRLTCGAQRDETPPVWELVDLTTP